MEATLNVRMERQLKERGDKVLREHGISTSAAVRALWRELAKRRSLPEFLQEEERGQAADARLGELRGLAGIARGALTDATDDELERIGRQRYA